MTADGHISPPFGTYALTPAREVWRERARQFSDSVIGRAMISFCRKRALKGLTEPFDVRVEHDIYARLYPSENRTDKRVIAGSQIWEPVERQALFEALKNAKTSPFVFLDVGANIGMYSLYVDQMAKDLGQPANIIAIEPSFETGARLHTNIKASEANITIIPVAVSDTSGTAYLTGGEDNRGEAHLSTSGESVDTVKTDTLLSICQAQGLDYISALKIDIEGHELPALSAFFDTAHESLHPDMLILETRHADESKPVVEMCLSRDYVINNSTRHNSIFIKTKKTHHVQA